MRSPRRSSNSCSMTVRPWVRERRQTRSRPAFTPTSTLSTFSSRLGHRFDARSRSRGNGLARDAHSGLRVQPRRARPDPGLGPSCGHADHHQPPGLAHLPRRPGLDWATEAMDSDVYASPIVAGGLVLIATENDTVYAFDAASGHQRWSRHLGQPVDASALPCGNIRPVSGITGTPVADASGQALYVVGFVRPAQHVLYTLDLASGVVRGQRRVDPPGDSPLTEP